MYLCGHALRPCARAANRSNTTATTFITRLQAATAKISLSHIVSRHGRGNKVTERPSAKRKQIIITFTEIKNNEKKKKTPFLFLRILQGYEVVMFWTWIMISKMIFHNGNKPLRKCFISWLDGTNMVNGYKSMIHTIDLGYIDKIQYRFCRKSSQR